MLRPFGSIFAVLAVIFLLAAVTAKVCEQTTFTHAINIVFPAFLGELGEIQCNYRATQVCVLIALIVSVASLAIITAKITTLYMNFCNKGGCIVNKVHASGHVLIAGWNYQGEGIVRELLSSGMKEKDIAVLARSERRLIAEQSVDFVSGDPTRDADLLRAGVKRADGVIVLSDLSKTANEADAEALMIALAVETLHRDTYTCVQVMNSDNRIHLERANVDEIICLDAMGGNLAVASATNHGISCIINELLTFNSGSEFYRYDGQLSEAMVGQEFAQAACELSKRRVILLGVETDDSNEMRSEMDQDIVHDVAAPDAEGDSRVIVVNPQSEYRLRQGDALFYLAESKVDKI